MDSIEGRASGALGEGARIAVIGAGVAGIVAAHLLQRRYAVTLYESEARLGGHTNTVTLEDGAEVDTGFIVLNDQTYPLFNRFLASLGIATRQSDMSFAYECRETGFSYAGTSLNGLFAERRNIVSPSFYRFLSELGRFAREGRSFLNTHALSDALTLREFLERRGFNGRVRDAYLLPIAGAIWSAPVGQMSDFPVMTLLRFFANHGLLSLRNRPRWQTVVGGSHAYVKAFARAFAGRIVKLQKVNAIRRNGSGAEVITRDESAKYDAVVIAAHADQALRMLEDPTAAEREILGAWRYQPNHTVLHSDTSVLPRLRRGWASWNSVRLQGTSGEDSLLVSYHLNRLQGLTGKTEYVVSLNPGDAIDPTKIHREFQYEHPVYDPVSVTAQARLGELQGAGRRYFCGSYFGYGFHEDAVRSAVGVASLLGVEL